MSTALKLDHLIQLVRLRYDDWRDFVHPSFEKDEILYKQATIAKAAKLINQLEMDRLIAADEFDELLQRLERIARDNNMLWRRVPSAGDTAVFSHPALDKPTFCTQMRNLLYGDRPSPERLQTFSTYLTTHDLPNKWPLPTYFLFICHPNSDLFVKPRTANWFLKFMGTGRKIGTKPNTAVYTEILQRANWLREALTPFGVRDMVDVQSIIWVAAQESKSQTGRLDSKGQIELDIPPSAPEPIQYSTTLSSNIMKEPSNEPITSKQPLYSLATCATELNLPETELLRWIQAIHRKGQAIFYGSPGTSKTFVAQKLAQHLTSASNGFWELIQFHPTYAYEDFMQGLRPLTDSNGNLRYELIPGRFLQFCQQARQSGDICVFIIDEINRANLSSVLGELMLLLEYREAEIPLAGGGTFSIPANVRILGTMNTADRSIALVDHALRRRFAFIHLTPNMALLRQYHQDNSFDPAGLITVLTRLNRTISDPHYAIGHSYFLLNDIADQLADIWQMEIEPYLEEFFFDQPNQVDAFRWSKIKHQI